MVDRLVVLTCVLAAATSACQNDTGGIVNAPGCSDSAATGSGAAASAIGGGAVTADRLVAAMGGPEPSTAPVFLGNGYAAAVFSGLGGLEPTQGSTFAWLATGIAGAGTNSIVVSGAEDSPEPGLALGGIDCAGAGSFDCVTLTYAFVVPADHHSVRFDFNFLSTEFPEFTGNIYNDRFSVSLASASFNFPNITVDQEGDLISINNALFTDDDCEDFPGTGFDIDTGFGSCDAGATGLLGTIAPVAPGETVTLTFVLAEEGDGLYDSAVMIDNVETSEANVDDPVTNDCD